MNVKYAVALILALQVSVSVCDVQQPSPELLAKYNEMKATFMSRVQAVFKTMQENSAPLMESAAQNENAGIVKTFVENLQENPDFQNVVKFIAGVGQEATPLVDMARSIFLHSYEEHLRPAYGEKLDKFINERVKPFLDRVAPVPAQ